MPSQQPLHHARTWTNPGPSGFALAAALLLALPACAGFHHPDPAQPEPLPAPSAEVGGETAPESPDRNSPPSDPTPGPAGDGTSDTPGAQPPEPQPAAPVPTELTPAVAPAPSDPLAELQRRHTAVVERLVEATRRLYDAAPDETHGQLLVDMLKDPLLEIRALGLTLIDRELADAERLPPSVGLALADLLTSPQTRVRTDAARLLNRLAQPGVETAIADALDRETEPEAAAELLAAAARQPSERLVEPTLRWLASGLPARPAAAQAGLALARAGFVSPATADRMAAILREIELQQMASATLRLFARVGTHEDRARLRPLLESPDAATRLAVAESLAADPTFVDALLARAAADPTMLDFAVRALALHRPSLLGLQQLQALPFPSEEARSAAIAQLTSGMDLSELILAADEAARWPSSVQAYLGKLADASPPADPRQAILHARGLLRLAEAQLKEDRPDRALALADRVEPYASALPEPDRPRFQRVVTIALLWLERFTDPALDTSDPDHWLEGLEILGGDPQGPDVAEAFLRRFGQSLTQAQRTRFADLEAKFLTGPRPAPRPDAQRRPVPIGPG